MARIAGVEIPNKKHAVIGLTHIFGIGRSSATVVLEKAGIEPGRKVGDLTEAELDKMRKIVDHEFTTEGSLRAQSRMNIKRLMDIGCYRGLRHRKNLPVRGQRSRTNARTRKGPRKTIAGKRKAPSKG